MKIPALRRPADPHQAPSLLAQLYSQLQLAPPPTILWCDSPRAALERVQELGCQHPEGLFAGHQPPLIHALMTRYVKGRKTHRAVFPDPAWAHTKEGKRLQSRAQHVAQALRALGPSQWTRTFQFDAQSWCGDRFELRRPVCMDFDAVAETLYEVKKLAARIEPALATLADLACLCGWLWPFEQVAVLAASPQQSHFDGEGRLHHEHGPALRYPDGWSLYALHGQSVPARLVENPASLQEEEILEVADLELQKTMVARLAGRKFHHPLLQKLARMVNRQQFFFFGARHLPDGCKPWPKDLPMPVPPNPPGDVPPDGLYSRLYPDGQLQLLAWALKGQMIYLLLERGKAAGFLHLHRCGEQYLEDGRVEDFSPWDDTSKPYAVEESFEEWVRTRLDKFPGGGRAVLARG